MHREGADRLTISTHGAKMTEICVNKTGRGRLNKENNWVIEGRKLYEVSNKARRRRRVSTGLYS